jgi:peptide/nickel transport system permease protein
LVSEVLFSIVLQVVTDGQLGMQDFWRRFRRDRLAVIGLGMILLLLVLGLFAPAVAPYDPNQQFFDGLTLEGSPLPPGERFWFGTDTNGRDQFSRLLYGARTSLLIGILANGIAVIIGSFLGVTAGYLRGTAGAAIMRLTDLMMAFPPLLLAIALAAILKPGLAIIIVVIALVNWVQIARVIYAETVGLSERDYIEAARALGAGPLRILFRHLLPHLVPTITVYATLGIATTVLLEAMLSFLGRGVQPPTPAWGMMIFESQSYFLSAPWLVFIPGAAILILALSFNLVGDGLRDALDPTQRDRSG